MIVLFIFLLFATVLFLAAKKQPPAVRTKRTAVLLTTCVRPTTSQSTWVDSKDRAAMYEAKIRAYVDRASVDVFVVESSGHEFPISRQYVFVPDRDYSTSTQAEADAILGACRSGMLDGYDRVVKITGKYFAPDIDRLIAAIPEDAGIVYQKPFDGRTQSTEIFGFDLEHADAIFEPMLASEEIMERAVVGVHERLGVRAHRFPKIRLEKPYVKRASGDVIEYL